MSSSGEANCLRELLTVLKDIGYSFHAPTPETHQVVLDAQKQAGSLEAKSLTDIFGWSLPFKSETLTSLLPSSLVEELIRIEGITPSSSNEQLWTCKYRVSSLRTAPGSQLYLHSSFPPIQDTVFFGPDTYRFLAYLDAHLPSLSLPKDSIAVDVCTGGGAGAQALLDHFPGHSVKGLDINPAALQLAQINVPSNNVEFLESSLLAQVRKENVGLVISNPPFISGEEKPTYASGGKEGLGLTFQIISESEGVLKVGGKLVLYTGVTMDWREPMRDLLREKVDKSGAWKVLRYDILDVDVFANEIGKAGYEQAGRTQVIGCVLEKI